MFLQAASRFTTNKLNCLLKLSENFECKARKNRVCASKASTKLWVAKLCFAQGRRTTSRRRRQTFGLQALQSKALYGGKTTFCKPYKACTKLTKLCVQKLCFCKYKLCKVFANRRVPKLCFGSQNSVLQAIQSFAL